MIMDEKKLFYDLYDDGTMDYYYMTFRELVDTFGMKGATKIWKFGYIPEDVEPLYPGQQDDYNYDNIDTNLSLDEFISSYLLDE